MGLYALFCVLLLVLALAIGRRSRPPLLAQMPADKRKLPRRTVAMAVSALLLIPVTLFIGVFYLQRQQYAIVSVLVLFECMLPFFLVFEPASWWSSPCCAPSPWRAAPPSSCCPSSSR